MDDLLFGWLIFWPTNFCLRPSGSETNKSECDWLPSSLTDRLPHSGRFVEIQTVNLSPAVLTHHSLILVNYDSCQVEVWTLDLWPNRFFLPIPLFRKLFLEDLVTEQSSFEVLRCHLPKKNCSPILSLSYIMWFCDTKVPGSWKLINGPKMVHFEVSPNGPYNGPFLFMRSISEWSN